MRLRSKYYPYPVIIENGGYYEKSTFVTKLTHVMDGFNIKLTIETELQDTKLNEMLNNGDIVYAHHIECPQTCYRCLVKTREPISNILIKDTDVSGIVQICSFVISNKFIEKYENDCFSADYRGFKFNIEKGCVLAVGNQYEIRINRIRDDFSGADSIFSVVPNLDRSENNILVDTSQQKIIIKIPERTYQQYYNIQNYIDIQPVLHSSIIVPALMYVLSFIQGQENVGDMEYYRWFRMLKKACEKISVTLDDDNINQIDIFKVSQQLMESPIIKAIDFMAIGGGVYED